MSADERIFVRIAAYREFDLVPTLRDMLAMAADPDRLRICICWQHAPDDSLEGLAGDPRIEVIDVPHVESKGMCWARNMLQKRWEGEDFTLGIDGHHRFVPHWDSALVDRLKALQRNGYPKPILGGYAPGFDPKDDPAGRTREVWVTGFDRFEERGVVFMRPHLAPAELDGPVPCRFWSGHFNFTVGEWNAEVLTDPDAYFHSEEIVMTVRSWTHGYDLFNPDVTLLWHEYSRGGRICHWDDHANWGELSDAAIADYTKLFGVDGRTPDPGYAYGFGTERSLDAYERFAGLDFGRRGAQRYTIDNGLPPNPAVPDHRWDSSLLFVYEHEVTLPRRLLEQDCDFCGVFAQAEDGAELHRRDYSSDEIVAILQDQSGPLVQMRIKALARERPARWTVWPHSASLGWLEQISHPWG